MLCLFFSPSILLCRPNIPLSTSSQNLVDLNSHTTYIPPHPQQGTPYHRYVILLLPQPPLGAQEYTLAAASRATPESSASVMLDIPVVPMEQRRGFDVRAFAQRWNLDGAKGGGAHMFREVWDEEVSKIYKTILGQWHTYFCCGTAGKLVFLRHTGTPFWSPSKSRRVCPPQRDEKVYHVDSVRIVNLIFARFISGVATVLMPSS